MPFNNFYNDFSRQVFRELRSRKENKTITSDRIYELNKLYFKNLSKNQNNSITVRSNDLDDILFILRVRYHLWLVVKDNRIIIYKNFPRNFIAIKDVNKLNHPHVPKPFKKGTLLYFNSSNYGTCNWLNGIPLWDCKDDILEQGLLPSCQINYDYIGLI